MFMSWPRFSGHSWPMTISSGVPSPPSIIGRCDGGLPISTENKIWQMSRGKLRANCFWENKGDDGDNDDNLDHLHVDTSQQIMIKITKVGMMMMMMMMMFNTDYRYHYSDCDNRPFVGSHSRGTKPPCWRTIVGFVPREWLATKGLLWWCTSMVQKIRSEYM